MDKTADTNIPNENPPIKRKKRFNILNPFGNAYRQTKLDAEKKKKSILFGILSILFSFLCVGLAYPCVWLGVKGIVFSFTTYMGFFTIFFAVGNILLACICMGAFVIPYFLWIHGIILVIMQLILNRRFIGWLALLVWLASLVGVFWLSIETFSAIVG